MSSAEVSGTRYDERVISGVLTTAAWPVLTPDRCPNQRPVDGVERVDMDLSPPEPELFRRVLGRFASGVVIVTAMLDGAPYGMTVNAFTSVSLTPPLILVCVRRGSRLLTALARSRAFAVNVLSEDQVHLAHYFARAGRASGLSAFAGVDTATSPLGSPLIADAIAHLDCRLYGTRDGGDHVICLGEVHGLSATTRTPPLLFTQGRFAGLGAPWPPADASEPMEWPWI